MAKRVYRADGPEPPADVVALYGDLHGHAGRYLVRAGNGGWIWAASPRASALAGASWESQAECATSVLVEVRVDAADQRGVTSGLGDQLQTPEMGTASGRSVTNPASAGQDTGDGRNDVSGAARDELILAIAHSTASERNLGPRPWECGQCERAERIADRLLAAGWTPPLPEPACTCEYPYDGAPGSGHHPGCDVFGSPLPADEVEWGYRNGPNEDDHWSVDTEASARQWVERAIPGLRVLGQRRPAGPWSVVEPVEPKETPDA